jgi:gamma-D-glutamyl-L-lysine dipeptidyl-peptidase
MQFAVCCVPVSPLRAEPSHRSEMVSQLIFGECCELLETGKDKWIKVQCRYDGYEGWCHENHVTEIDEAIYRAAANALAEEWINHIDYNGHPMMVPLGSILTGMKNGNAQWRKNTVHFSGKTWNIHDAKKDTSSIKHLAFQFLNTAYLWGGKTVFGTDCSGYTQTVFRFFDIPLLRDAWQQATQGEVVGFLQEAKCGDLAFFDNDEGKITHVGILLNESEIIHASGKVRVDKIDSQGIVNSETSERTHKLRIIKRVVDVVR